ncbi:MAG: polysaccharide biosynthesis/export family protein [Planctomycetales bacterium]|nr:polysaccharide biosynthesis/export family protein [Planctomycetales bacterium]
MSHQLDLPLDQPSQPWMGIVVCALAGLLSLGCAAVTNPVANGIPVRILPEELKAESREGLEQIPLTALRQAPPEEYILAAGDTLGVYVEGILGEAESPPPVNLPDSPELPPSIGYPFPIRDDGTISLPYVGSVEVAGLTVEQAEQAVVDAYLKKEILRPDDQRILVSLLRSRTVRVLVLREDSPGSQVSLQNQSLLGLGTTTTTIGGGGRATGDVVELPAYQNDVLSALARSGGLPGLESNQEIVIQRGYWDATQKHPDDANAFPPPAFDPEKPRVIRIPLRIRPGQPLPFNPRDVILQTGDIISIRGRDPEFYYTGGLIPSAEHPLPNNYDLTVMEAVLKSRGPLLNGGINSNNLNGAVVGAGIGNPSPNLVTVLRKTPNGGLAMIRVEIDAALRDPRQDLLVQAEDVLILQETPDQGITRYMTQIFNFNIFGRAANHTDAQVTGTITGP